MLRFGFWGLLVILCMKLQLWIEFAHNKKYIIHILKKINPKGKADEYLSTIEKSYILVEIGLQYTKNGYS